MLLCLFEKRCSSDINVHHIIINNLSSIIIYHGICKRAISKSGCPNISQHDPVRVKTRAILVGHIAVYVILDKQDKTRLWHLPPTALLLLELCPPVILNYNLLPYLYSAYPYTKYLGNYRYLLQIDNFFNIVPTYYYKYINYLYYNKLPICDVCAVWTIIPIILCV